MQKAVWFTVFGLVACSAPATDGDGGSGGQGEAAGSGGSAAGNDTGGTSGGGGSSSTGGADAATSEVGARDAQVLPLGEDSGAGTLDAGSDRSEDCENGLDDDDDGKVDCADTDCGDQTCVTVPEGWTGPVIVWGGDLLELPYCEAPYTSALVVGQAGLSAPPAICPVCECEAATLGCELITSIHDAEDCGGTVTEYEPLNPNTCYAVDSGPSVDLRFDATGGACEARTLGEVALPTSGFTSALLACGLPPTSAAAGCADGAVCAHTAPAPFEEGACVYRTGEHDCPSAFPTRDLVYASFDDTRSCTECGCDTASCAGSVELYVNQLCGVGRQDIDVDGEACTDVTDPSPGNGLSLAYENATAACPVVQSEPLGGVAGSEPTTVCCE